MVTCISLNIDCLSSRLLMLLDLQLSIFVYLGQLKIFLSGVLSLAHILHVYFLEQLSLIIVASFVWWWTHCGQLKTSLCFWFK